MISRMLDVEDVEDVACSVHDIESTDRLGSLVQRGWSRGRWDKCTRTEMMECHCPCPRCTFFFESGGSRLWRPRAGNLTG